MAKFMTMLEKIALQDTLAINRMLDKKVVVDCMHKE